MRYEEEVYELRLGFVNEYLSSDEVVELLHSGKDKDLSIFCYLDILLT